MKFRIVERRIKKPEGAAKKRRTVYMIQYRHWYTGWRYAGWPGDKDKNGDDLYPVYNRYEHASFEMRRLRKLNAIRLFGRPLMR